MSKCILIVALALCTCMQAALAVTIQGRVLRDDTGEALPWAEVRIARTGSQFLEAHLESGQDGQFHAEGLPEGRYTVTVERGGFLSARLPLEDPGQPLVVRLIRAGSISGRVVNQHGDPFTKAQVSLMERTQGGMLRSLGRTAPVQADGRYRFSGLRPGRYLLSATFETALGHSFSGLYPTGSKPEVLTITGGEDFPNCDFVGETGSAFRVSGRVEHPPAALPPPSPEDTAQPAKPALPRRDSVALSLAEEPGVLVAWAQTEPDGSFAFPAVPWGSYTLHAAGPAMGYGFGGSMLARDARLGFAQMPLQVSADTDDLALALEDPRSLQLLLDGDASARGDCPPALSAALSPLEAWGAMLQREVKLIAGEPVTVENLAPARYELLPASAAAGGCQVRLAQPIDLRSGSPAEPVKVRASASGSIAGTIADPPRNGKLQVLLLPLAMKPSSAFPRAPDAVSIATPDAAGAFRFDEVAPGRYALHVSASGSSASQSWFRDSDSLVEVEVIGGTVEVVLNAPADLSP